jgi:hypothetical protein
MRNIGTAEHAWVPRPTSHLRLTAAHHHHWSTKGTSTTPAPIQSQSSPTYVPSRYLDVIALESTPGPGSLELDCVTRCVMLQYLEPWVWVCRTEID